MMSAGEYRKIMIRKNLLIILFLCLCIIGVTGMIVYYNKLKTTTAALETTKNNLQESNKNLEIANQYLLKLKDTLEKQKENYANVLTSNDPKAIKMAARTIEKSRDSARKYSREGYYKLKAKNFEGARADFDKSEKFYNGYRDSYDVYFLLWKNRGKLNEPKVQQQVMQQILTKYNSLRILSKDDL